MFGIIVLRDNNYVPIITTYGTMILFDTKNDAEKFCETNLLCRYSVSFIVDFKTFTMHRTSEPSLVKMTAKELATEITGCDYGDEISPHLEQVAKENGLVVVFGYSDDNCEFRGAINEEIPCWQGRKIYFDKSGSNFTNESGIGFLDRHQDKEAPESNMINAVWCNTEQVFYDDEDYYSWTYKTDIPHETFDIFEGGRPFCRGIIFSISDCK